MGHGYFVIIGFGVVVPLSKFVDKYEELFSREEDSEDQEDYVFNGDELRELEIAKGICIYYDEQSRLTSDSPIFVCGTNHYFADARCDSGECQKIDVDWLGESRSRLQKFLKQTLKVQTLPALSTFYCEGC